MEYIQIIIWIGIISCGIAIWVLLKYENLADPKPAWKIKAVKKLNLVEQNKNLDQKYKLLELDKIMEYILQSKYSSTMSFGDLMKEYGDEFSNTARNQIWSAHKIRNKIVHDIHYNPNRKEIAESVKNYIKIIQKMCE
jgi:hypothetical protein